VIEKLNLVDVFWTFQGEGEQWGRRALFVRLPFCNLKCSWCDTEFNKYQTYTIEQFQKIATEEPTRFAVVTGGEPMMNKQTPLVVQLLKNLGFKVACETNGTFPIVTGIDFVTISPKRDAGYRVVDGIVEHANEIKLVVDKDFDFNEAKKFEFIYQHTNVRLSLSPEFTEMKANIDRIEKFIKENPKWRISLQTHKWMGVK
jgi:7-carboxy-7-deazaguanine synthase